MMQYTISELALLMGINKSSYEIRNEKPFFAFSRVTSIAQSESCVFLTEKKYVKQVAKQKYFTMIITNPEIAVLFDNTNIGLCVTENPKVLYNKFLDYINRRHEEESKNKTIIDTGCYISKNAHIYEHDVILGKNVVVEDYAVIYPHTRIGDGCIIGTNAIIGGQDYNYYFENGIPKHIYHGGCVEIGKNVEVGCNSGIGRALYIEKTTKIGDDCKISANCGVGHDSLIGNRVMIYSGSMIGGNVIIEDDVHITLNCTVKNGVKIGKGAMICMGSNVLTNVKEGIKMFGNPARKMEL